MGVSGSMHSLVVVITPRTGEVFGGVGYKGLRLAVPWPSCSVLSDRYERGGMEIKMLGSFNHRLYPYVQLRKLNRRVYISEMYQSTVVLQARYERGIWR